MEVYQNPFLKHKQKKKHKENSEDDEKSLIPEHYRLAPKDEKLHMKTLRTFFFIHAIVSFEIHSLNVFICTGPSLQN